VLKYIDISTFSIKKKIAFSTLVLLIFLFIIVLLANRQIRTMAIDASIIVHQEVPTISALNLLDKQLYQQSILRKNILLAAQNPTITENEQAKLESMINNYKASSVNIVELHKSAKDLMKNYAKLEMPSTKRRWKRLQEDQQKLLNSHFDKFAQLQIEHEQLSNKALSVITSGEILETQSLEVQIEEIDSKLHSEIDTLSKAANNGIASYDNKIIHLDFGARQIIYFLLFWFCLIGIVVAYVIARLIISQIKIADDFANKIVSGETPEPMEIKTQDEFGELMKTMNKIPANRLD